MFDSELTSLQCGANVRGNKLGNVRKFTADDVKKKNVEMNAPNTFCRLNAEVTALDGWIVF